MKKLILSLYIGLLFSFVSTPLTAQECFNGLLDQASADGVGLVAISASTQGRNLLHANIVGVGPAGNACNTVIGVDIAPGDIVVNVEVSIGFEGDASLELVNNDCGIAVELVNMNALGCGAGAINGVLTFMVGSPAYACGDGPGTYAPTGDFADFAACEAFGSWSIIITDHDPLAISSVTSWGLSMNNTTTGGVLDCTTCSMDAGTHMIVEDGGDASTGNGTANAQFLCFSDAALNDSAGGGAAGATHDPSVSVTSNDDFSVMISETTCDNGNSPPGVFYDVFDDIPTSPNFNDEVGNFVFTIGSAPATTAQGPDPGVLNNTAGGNMDYYITTTASNGLEGTFFSQGCTDGSSAFDMNTDPAGITHVVLLNQIQANTANGACASSSAYAFELTIMGGLPDYDANGGTVSAAPGNGETYTVNVTASGGQAVVLSNAAPVHNEVVTVTVPDAAMGEMVTFEISDANGCTIVNEVHTIAETCICVAEGGTMTITTNN